ncbi:MAG: immunoglobulin domain-containing protein [Verrucomicrobiales bacterium]|nr:immunoglobulin domain-containing protein [Verrucomicrobiales bacterium]
MGHSWGYTTVLALTNCVVVGNSGVGLDAYGTTVELPTTGTLIASNQVGIAIQTQGAKVEGLSGNDVWGNLEFELRNNGPGAVVVTNNYWGEPTTTELIDRKTNLSRIWDSRDDANAGQVIIRPFSETCFACTLPPSPQVYPSAAVSAPGGEASFTVTTGGTPPFNYRWERLVDAVWVPIPNAEGAVLSLQNVSPEDGGRYRAIVSNSYGTSVAQATLTVSTDDAPPSVLQAIALDGISVALFFDERLEPASAGNRANYAGGPGQTVTEVRVGADQQTVFLTLDGSAPTDLQVSYHGVRDAIGNPGSGTVAVLNCTGGDVGEPGQAGSVKLIEGGGIEAMGGGVDLGGQADSFHYVYFQAAGDFDIQVRVTELAGSNAWAKAGLLVRESLAAGSRHYGHLVTPADGRNVNFVQFRLEDGQDALLPNELWRPCNYPNNWLRLQRSGTVFKSLVSGDGTGWAELHELDTTPAPYPGTVYLGLATTAHDSASRATARYSDLRVQMGAAEVWLEYAVSAGELELSWPTGVTGYVLQHTEALLPAAWVDVTTGVVVVGDKHTKSVNPIEQSGFYRLIKR